MLAMLPKEQQPSILLSLSSKYKQAPEDETETSLGEKTLQLSSSTRATQSEQSRDAIPLALSCLLAARWGFIPFCTLCCGPAHACVVTVLNLERQPPQTGGSCLHGFFFSCSVLAGV